jgi:hypothetical protein
LANTSPLRQRSILVCRDKKDVNLFKMIFT